MSPDSDRRTDRGPEGNIEPRGCRFLDDKVCREGYHDRHALPGRRQCLTLQKPFSIALLIVFPTIFLWAHMQIAGGTTQFQKPIEGAKIFRDYCASCHGVDARGHGPASVALRHPVPDLTRISQRNGGKFPAENIKRTILGTDVGPPAHGDREMPIWGPIFHVGRTAQVPRFRRYRTALSFW